MKETNSDSWVFEQNCSDYLNSLGFNVNDGDNINCPYRSDADSESFSINGPLYYDHVTGEGGNVWHLALRMHGNNRLEALRSLYQSAGIPFIESPKQKQELRKKDIACNALVKIQERFGINDITTPKEVLDYLKSRCVSPKSYHYFAYIPSGELSKTLTKDEIELTGLGQRENLIILWYLKGGKPVYYCTRDITTKQFKKASCENGILEHPIWNCDDLYCCEHVVWGEGMFDCVSLSELGYGVAGEITCHLIEKHKPQLLTALRWRAKHHPDWTFTICLDNDAPTKNGSRPGNEAAEKIALWLWSQGVDVKWVKHDEAKDKVDINHLHQNNLQNHIKSMIDGAKFVSEILAYDEKLTLQNMVKMLNCCDYRGAARMMGLLQKQDKNEKISAIIDAAATIPWNWRDVYNKQVRHIFMYDSDIYAVFDHDLFGENQKHYETFGRSTFASNMRQFQNNKLLNVSLKSLDIEYRRPTWRVSKDNPMGDTTFNLFTPSPLLLQEPQGDSEIPAMWEKVLNNLAGGVEKEWLLNHLAVYVQTLKKPKTMPVLVGGQGTGKTSLAELFGKGVGGFVVVGNTEMESQFNSYLMNPVVLLDELANSQKDTNKLKNKLKSFINEYQQINEKNRAAFRAELNNYIIIASNEQTTHVPLVIESDDRRYTIISGGLNRNLAHESWYDYDKLKEDLPRFMLYLLSRKIDVKYASVPLHNDAKQRIIESGEDFRQAYVREYLEALSNEISQPCTKMLSHLCNEINEKYMPSFKYTSRMMRPIVEAIGFSVKRTGNQWSVVITPNHNATWSETSVSSATDDLGHTASQPLSTVQALDEVILTDAEFVL